MTKSTDEVVWRGPDELRDRLVPIGAVRPHPRNPKDHDLGAIASSLARFGQQVPILVQRSTGHIVAGNGRWEALSIVSELERRFGVRPARPWTHVAAVFTDLDDDAALAYAVADNRTHDLAGWNDEKLGEILAELAGKGSLDGIGYDADDVDSFLASLEPFVPTGETKRDIKALESEVLVEIRCDRATLLEIQPRLRELEAVPGVTLAIV